MSDEQVRFDKIPRRLSPLLSRQSRVAVGIGALLALAAYTSWLGTLAGREYSSLIMLSIFAAALVSSVAGFAFSVICGAMLFHLVDDPVRAVQIMMICSVGGQALMVWSLRRQIVWRTLWSFLAGAVFGLPLGVLLLLQTKASLYTQAVGVLILLYATYMLTRRPMVVQGQRAAYDVVAGFLSGITGGAAAFPGAFVTIWCGFKGWSKEQQRGLYQPFIMIVQLAAIALMELLPATAERPISFDFSGIVYLPAVLIGASFGMILFSRLNDREFGLAVNLLLIVSGVSFLV